jgi:hypothetical protein
MAIGRPLSTTTMVKRLRHLRDNSLVDYPDQAAAVDRMGNLLLDVPLDQQTPAALRHMVRDLVMIINDCTMSNAERKLLGTVLDNMERRLEQLGQSKTSTMKQRAKIIDPVALIEVPTIHGKPDWMLANEATTKRRMHISAVCDLIRVVLVEIEHGNNDSAFDDLDAFVRTLKHIG